MTTTTTNRRSKRRKDNNEWAPVQDTIIKRHRRKQPDHRKDKEDVMEFLDDIESRLDVMCGDLLQGEDLFIKKKRGKYRSNWIRILEGVKHDIDMFTMDVKEYGLTEDGM